MPIGDVQPGKDAVDVEQAAHGDEAGLLRGGAGHVARFLPLSEVLVHGRHHHHQGGEHVIEVGLPTGHRLAHLGRGVVDGAGHRLEHRRFRQRVAGRAHGAVAVQIDLRAAPLHLGAPQHRLGEVVEQIAGALQRAVRGDRQGPVQGFGRILGRGRAGIDPDVVVRQGRHAGDDPFAQLVGGAGFHPGVAPGVHQPVQVIRLRLPRRLIVEVVPGQQLPVVGGYRAQRAGGGPHGRGVGEGVLLDREQVGGGLLAGRRRAQRLACQQQRDGQRRRAARERGTGPAGRAFGSGPRVTGKWYEHKRVHASCVNESE